MHHSQVEVVPRMGSKEENQQMTTNQVFVRLPDAVLSAYDVEFGTPAQRRRVAAAMTIAALKMEGLWGSKNPLDDESVVVSLVADEVGAAILGALAAMPTRNWLTYGWVHGVVPSPGDWWASRSSSPTSTEATP